MAAEGAAVLVADINGESAAATVAEIQDDGGVALAQIGDVVVEADVEMAIEAVVAVRPARHPAQQRRGIRADDDLDVVDTPNDAWEAMLSSVLMAAVWGCKYAIPHMARAGGGSIINMSSGEHQHRQESPLRLRRGQGCARGAHHLHGCHVRARGCALQRGPPGFVTTEKALELFTDEILEGMRERSAAGRLAVPDDASPASRVSPCVG